MSGLGRLSHISRSVALSMLGFCCLAHSYWQRCHKTRLQGPISGKEEAVEKLTRRGPYARPVQGFPQAIFRSLSTFLPSLHHALLCQGYLGSRTSDFLKLSALQPPSLKQYAKLEKRKKRIKELKENKKGRS